MFFRILGAQFSKLTDFSPIYCDENGEGVVTQYDKNDVEEAGLVKFDFLGLRTLTIIQDTCDIIELDSGKKIDPRLFPLDDDKTYDLIKEGNTVSVFQFLFDRLFDKLERGMNLITHFVLP